MVFAANGTFPEFRGQIFGHECNNLLVRGQNNYIGSAVAYNVDVDHLLAYSDSALDSLIKCTYCFAWPRHITYVYRYQDFVNEQTRKQEFHWHRTMK